MIVIAPTTCFGELLSLEMGRRKSRRSGYQGKTSKIRAGARSTPHLGGPRVSDTLSKPAVLLEESLKVVEMIMTSIKKRGQLHESKAQHRGRRQKGVKKRI